MFIWQWGVVQHSFLFLEFSPYNFNWNGLQNTAQTSFTFWAHFLPRDVANLPCFFHLPLLLKNGKIPVISISNWLFHKISKSERLSRLIMCQNLRSFGIQTTDISSIYLGFFQKHWGFFFQYAHVGSARKVISKVLKITFWDLLCSLVHLNNQHFSFVSYHQEYKEANVYTIWRRILDNNERISKARLTAVQVNSNHFSTFFKSDLFQFLKSHLASGWGRGERLQGLQGSEEQ